MPKKKRDLLVLTRKEGVRKENPVITLPGGNGNEYYTRGVTPELRKEADELEPPKAVKAGAWSKLFVRSKKYK